MTHPADDGQSTTAEPAPGSLRELFQVAFPLVLSTGALSIMNVIDRILLTWHSADALAAALPAGVLHWTVISLALGTVLYGNTFVAQYEGAGRPDRVVAVIWQAVYVSIIAGILLLAVLPLTPAIVGLIGHHSDLQRLEIDYYWILCAGSFPFVLSNALSCFFSGRRQTMVVMWVNVVSVIVNGVLDYLLIFGKFGCPELGIKGAALATVAARAVAAVLYIGLMLGPRVRKQYDFVRGYRFDPELFRRFMRFGVPNGFHMFLDLAGFSMFVFLVGGLGKTQMAATSLAFNVNAFAFVPLLGVGTAVMTLVGNRIGEQRPQLAVRTTWVAFGAAGGWMLAFGIVIVGWPDVAILPYSQYNTEIDFTAIHDHVAVLFRFVAAYSFFDAMLVVFSHAVRGAGDTRFSLWYTAACCWLLMVVPTWIASTWFGGNLMVSWTACTVYIVVAGVGFMVRFLGGRWKSMSVIEQSRPDDAAGLPDCELASATAE